MADDLKRVTYLAIADHKGKSFSFGVKEGDRLKHLQILGDRTPGKAALLQNLIVQDAEARRGILCLCTKSSTVEDLLACLPENRLGDILYFDSAPREPLDLKRVISERKLVFVNLHEEESHEDFMSDLGDTIEQVDGEGFHIYIAGFASVAEDVPVLLLPEATKRGFGMTVLYDHPGSLPRSLYSAMLGSIGSTIAFHLSENHLDVLGGSLFSTLDNKRLMELGPDEFYIKLLVDGAARTPFKVRALAAPRAHRSVDMDKIHKSSLEWLERNTKPKTEKLNPPIPAPGPPSGGLAKETVNPALGIATGASSVPKIKEKPKPPRTELLTPKVQSQTKNQQKLTAQPTTEPLPLKQQAKPLVPKQAVSPQIPKRQKMPDLSTQPPVANSGARALPSLGSNNMKELLAAAMAAKAGVQTSSKPRPPEPKVEPPKRPSQAPPPQRPRPNPPVAVPRPAPLAQSVPRAEVQPAPKAQPRLLPKDMSTGLKPETRAEPKIEPKSPPLPTSTPAFRPEPPKSEAPKAPPAPDNNTPKRHPSEIPEAELRKMLALDDE